MGKDTQKFDELIDDQKTVRAIPEYNRIILKLNSYLAREDDAKIEKLFVYADQVHLNERQKVDLYIRELMYYMDKSQKSKAQAVYQKLENTRDFDKIRPQIELPYQVMALNRTDKLDQLIQKSKTVEDPEKQVAYFMLIAHIYDVLKDKKQAEAYREKAKKIIENN